MVTVLHVKKWSTDRLDNLPVITQPDNGRAGLCSQVCLILLPGTPPLKSSVSAGHSGSPQCGSGPPALCPPRSLPSHPMSPFSGSTTSDSTPCTSCSFKILCFCSLPVPWGGFPFFLLNQLYHPSTTCANVAFCMNLLPASSSQLLTLLN